MSMPPSNTLLPPTKKGYFSRFRVLLLASFPIGLLLCFLCSGVITYVMPRKFESTAIIQVKPSADDANMSSFFATEFEVIRAKIALKMVAEKLELAKEWDMTEEDVVNSLYASVDVTNIRGTDLLSIRAIRTSPEDARNIVLAVVEVYKERRVNKEMESLADGLADLEKALMEQSAIVEEKGKKLNELKSKPVIRLQASDVEKITAKAHLDSLTNAKNDDERLLIATQVIKEDNIVKTANAEYMKAGQALETLANEGVKSDDPRYQKMQQIVSEQYAKMMELVKAYQDSLAQTANGEGSQSDPQAIVHQAAVQAATKEFETANQILDKMKERLSTEKINVKQPRNIVELHEEPIIAQYPVSPNVKLNLIAGAICGVTLFPLLVLLLTTLYHLLIPSKK